jgi:hypothetical protein
MCVSDRDIEIQQLESMLSLLLIGRCGENKRRCMKLTHEMAIKATSVMSEASSHVNFLLSLPDLPVMNHDRTAPAPGNRQGGPLFKLTSIQIRHRLPAPVGSLYVVKVSRV